MEPEDPTVILLALRYGRRDELFSARLVAADPAVLRLAPSLAPPRGDVVSSLTEDQLLALLGAVAAATVARVRTHPDVWYEPGRGRFLADDGTPTTEAFPPSPEARP